MNIYTWYVYILYQVYICLPRSMYSGGGGGEDPTSSPGPQLVQETAAKDKISYLICTGGDGK